MGDFHYIFERGFIMQNDTFNSILQDSLASVDKYFKMFVESNYGLTLIQTAVDYSKNVKNEVTEQFNSLSSEIQTQTKNTYNEIIEKCDAILNGAADKIKKTQEILSLSNDTFYNDATYDTMHKQS
jgi:hypothetical protein